MGNQRTPFGAEQVEELPQRGLVPPGRGPDQPAAVVINHHREVLVVALVGDLVDPDSA